MLRTRFLCALCGFAALVHLSCSRSTPESLSTPIESSTPTPSATAGTAADIGAAPDASSAAKSESTADRAAGETIDADELLKATLARAADEQKRVLVHLGAPG